jgi:hypothetical protein
MRKEKGFGGLSTKGEGFLLSTRTVSSIKPMFRGTVYADSAHPVTGTEVYLQQTSRSIEVINGDFLILEELGSIPPRTYFCTANQVEESPLYVRNPDSIVFLTRRLEAENRDIGDIAQLPEARKETKIVIQAKLHRTRNEDGIRGPGYRPSSVSFLSCTVQR